MTNGDILIQTLYDKGLSFEDAEGIVVACQTEENFAIMNEIISMHPEFDVSRLLLIGLALSEKK